MNNKQLSENKYNDREVDVEVIARDFPNFKFSRSKLKLSWAQLVCKMVAAEVNAQPR